MQNDNDKQFNYAHSDTSRGERESATAGINKLVLDGDIAALRKDAQLREVPVANDETLGFLIALAQFKNAKSILEVGCACGLTSLALARALPSAEITSIERDEVFFAEAQRNLSGLGERLRLILGEAGEVLPTLADNRYELIFLDCAKVQYIKLLPELKRVLKTGGALVADDVLLNGWVNGEREAPPKRKALVAHIREYLEAVTQDSGLSTSVIAIGDGVAFSVKR